MAVNHYFVVYKVIFFDGKFYIGKTMNYNRRMKQLKRANFSSCNLKDKTVVQSGMFYSKILEEAPAHFSDEDKQIWLDNTERIYIHKEAKRVYNEITGINSNYKDYSRYKDIINQKMVNTLLY